MSEIKYKQELRNLLADVFSEFAAGEDIDDFIQFTLEKSGASYEKLSGDLEIGIKNGISMEDQFRVIRLIIGGTV